MKKVLALVLTAATLFLCVVLPISAKSTYSLNGISGFYSSLMNETDPELVLGSLSAKYESNGNPGSISENKDRGGVSYGAYMFASNYDVPMSFVRWCQRDIEGTARRAIGDRLAEAYRADENKYGGNFNSVWTLIANEDARTFLLTQHNYVKEAFYDVMVGKLEARLPGFKADNYTMGLKNVIWARAVQHGVNSECIFDAINNIGGFNNQSEDVLIKAIYAESARLDSTAPVQNAVAITRESVDKLNISATVAGKYLHYFCLNTSDIQASVYMRLKWKEPNDALAMYDSYAGTRTEPLPVNPDVESGGSNDIISSLVSLAKLMLDLFVKFINMLASLAGNITVQ